MKAIDLKLMVACRAGRAKEVRRLILQGADVNAKHDSLSLTPIEIAVRSQHLRVLKTLLRSGADTGHKERFVKLLREAVMNGFLDASRLLTEYRINSFARQSAIVAAPAL